MKPIPRLWIVLSLTTLAVARPAISDRALRIPLERRARYARDPMSAQSVTSKQFLGADRVERFVSYAHKKYEATFAAYERNMGSRHPLDTLPRSSSTSPSKPARRGDVHLENDMSLIWYGAFGIGTPLQMFTGDFDTGSADLWVPDKHCYVTCDGHRAYDASQSSTSHDTPRPSFLQYGSGSVVISDVYTDTVQVAGYTLSNQEFGGAGALSNSFWNNRLPLSDQFPADAIFGLGFSEISALKVPPPVVNLNQSSQLPEGFLSFMFSDIPGRSELIVGDANYTAFKNDTRVYAPVTDEGYWQITLGGISRSGRQVPASIEQPAIVDTGTTLIVVPTVIANDYFSGVAGAQCTNGICTVPCDTINSTTPTLTIAGRNFPVCPSTWNFGPDESGSTNCITGMGTSDLFEFVIIGDVLLRNVYTIFDFRRLCVNFADLVDPVC